MWDAGNDDVAGLAATNRGVNASFRVMGWVVTHLRKHDANVDMLNTAELVALLRPYGIAVGEFFATMTPEEIKSIRGHYGTGAAAELAYRIGKYIKDTEPDFEADGLAAWIESKNKIDVNEAQRICTSLEHRLFTSVIARLKQEYGEDGWWRELPAQIRSEAASRRELETEDHPRETFLFLIDFRTIISSISGPFFSSPMEWELEPKTTKRNGL